MCLLNMTEVHSGEGPRNCKSTLLTTQLQKPLLAWGCDFSLHTAYGWKKMPQQIETHECYPRKAFYLLGQHNLDSTTQFNTM